MSDIHLLRVRRAHRALLVTGAGAAASLFLLRSWPPERYAFYPVCPFHQFTGLLCPGCGATRALAALLAGDLALAWQRNAFVVALLPVLAFYLTVAYYRAVRTRGPVWPRVPHAATLLLVLAALAFAVARNLG